MLNRPEPGTKVAAQLRPNPAAGSTSLRIDNLPHGKFRWSVLDLRGRAVPEQEDLAESAAVHRRIDTATWPDGIYFVRVETGDETRLLRLPVRN